MYLHTKLPRQESNTHTNSVSAYTLTHNVYASCACTPCACDSPEMVAYYTTHCVCTYYCMCVLYSVLLSLTLSPSLSPFHTPLPPPPPPLPLGCCLNLTCEDCAELSVLQPCPKWCIVFIPYTIYSVYTVPSPSLSSLPSLPSPSLPRFPPRRRRWATVTWWRFKRSETQTSSSSDRTLERAALPLLW